MSRRILISCFCTALLLGGCAQKEDVLILERKLYEQEQTLNALKSDLGKTSQEVNDVRPGQADLWSEVQAMKVQLAQIQGNLEDMQARTDAVPEVQTNVTQLQQATKDIEAGLRQIASELGIELEVYKNKPPAPVAVIPATQVAPTTTGSTTDSSSTARQPANSQAAVPPKTKPLTESADTKAQDPQDGITLTEPTPPVAVSPAKQPSKDSEVVPVDTAQQLYDTAYKAFSERRYRDAQTMWAEFETTFPKHSLVSNAVFWQGEALYQAQDYGRAALKYQDVIKKYPKSSKYRSALFKQGLALLKTGKTKAGKIRLNEVVKKFPKSAEAKRAKIELNKRK